MISFGIFFFHLVNDVSLAMLMLAFKKALRSVVEGHGAEVLSYFTSHVCQGIQACSLIIQVSVVCRDQNALLWPLEELITWHFALRC